MNWDGHVKTWVWCMEERRDNAEGNGALSGWAAGCPAVHSFSSCAAKTLDVKWKCKAFFYKNNALSVCHSAFPIPLVHPFLSLCCPSLGSFMWGQEWWVQLHLWPWSGSLCSYYTISPFPSHTLVWTMLSSSGMKHNVFKKVMWWWWSYLIILQVMIVICYRSVIVTQQIDSDDELQLHFKWTRTECSTLALEDWAGRLQDWNNLSSHCESHHFN